MTQMQIGERVVVNGRAVLIDKVKIADDKYHVTDEEGNDAGWHDGADLIGLPREPDLRELIAGAITTAERNFGYRVGAGEVSPGEYLSDLDKADDIMSALSAAGYKIVKGASS